MSSPALELQQRVIRRMSAEQKIRTSAALRAAAWELKAAWIRTQHPTRSEADVQEAVREWFRDAAP
jgi:hypothetical protein